MSFLSRLLDFEITLFAILAESNRDGIEHVKLWLEMEKRLERRVSSGQLETTLRRKIEDGAIAVERKPLLDLEGRPIKNKVKRWYTITTHGRRQRQELEAKLADDGYAPGGGQEAPA